MSCRKCEMNYVVSFVVTNSFEIWGGCGGNPPARRSPLDPGAGPCRMAAALLPPESPAKNPAIKSGGKASKKRLKYGPIPKFQTPILPGAAIIAHN